VSIVDFRRQLGIARKWLVLLVAGAVISAIAAFGLSSIQQPVYEAKTTLIVGQALQALNPDISQILASQRLSATYAAIATKRPALESVIDELRLDTTPDLLARRVLAQAPTESTLLILTAQDPDPAQAAAIADALADFLIESTPAIQGVQSDLQEAIEAELKATQEQILSTQRQVERLTELESPQPADLTTLEALQGRLVTLRSTYATLLSSPARNATNLLTIVEPAVAPTQPVSPRVLLNTLLAAVLGLLLAAAVAAVIEYLDDRVKDADAVQEVVGLSTLGTVAQMKGGGDEAELYRLATLLYPRSGVAEAYRTLRTNIEFASIDAPIRTLLVTSSGPHEGKTVTAANLAVAFAQAGRLTILVDADLRRPGIHSMFRMQSEPGLTTLLRRDGAELDEVALPTEQPNLRVLPTGPLPPNPAELLGSHRMREVVDRLKEGTELVIFDSPPVQAVTDAAVLSSYLDATVLVVDAGRGHRGALRHAREALSRAGANVLGVILNRVPEAAAAAEYGYYYDEKDADASGTSSSGKKRSRVVRPRGARGA
jgi:succinoglycan biosynthesis transport protein ExoP